MPRNYDLLERIRQQASMSKQIVSTKDKEYGYYAGAIYNDAEIMAIIDWILKNETAFKLDKETKDSLQLAYSFFNQLRKAYFATFGSTEITKLGFILGLEDDTVRATK